MRLSAFKELLRRYRQGKTSDEETRLVEEWYTSFGEELPDMDHGQKSALRNTLYERILRQTADKYATPKRIGRLWSPLAAAVALVCISLAAWHTMRRPDQARQPQEKQWVEITAGAGSLKKVKLPDSSMVWLNADSKLGFFLPFGNDDLHRKVTLIEGEAFFDVVPDADRPFVVNSNRLNTRVLGTSFTVRAYQELEDVRISVTTGSVEVTTPDQRVLGRLKAGEEVVFNKISDDGFVRRVDTHSRDAWMSGITYLGEVPFAELALVFRQTYGIRLASNVPAIRKQRYSIQIDRTATYENVVKAVCAIHKNHYRKEGDVIIIY